MKTYLDSFCVSLVGIVRGSMSILRTYMSSRSSKKTALTAIVEESGRIQSLMESPSKPGVNSAALITDQATCVSTAGCSWIGESDGYCSGTYITPSSQPKEQPKEPETIDGLIAREVAKLTGEPQLCDFKIGEGDFTVDAHVKLPTVAGGWNHIAITNGSAGSKIWINGVAS